jgi:hypothetical protein
MRVNAVASIAATIALIFSTLTHAGPAFIYTNQMRSVTGTASIGISSDIQSASAPDFGEFHKNIGANVLGGSENGNAFGFGQASQDSVLGAGEFNALGGVLGDGFHGSLDDGQGNGTAIFDVTFTLPQATRVQLNVLLDFRFSGENVPGSLVASVETPLFTYGPGQPDPREEDPTRVEFSGSGILPAGSYSVSLQAFASSAFETQNSLTYSIRLSGDPVAIPLPPALFGGAILLPGAIIAARGWTRMNV